MLLHLPLSFSYLIIEDGRIYADGDWKDVVGSNVKISGLYPQAVLWIQYILNRIRIQLT